MISRNDAINILHKHIKNINLFKHCLAAESAMKGLAKYFQEDENLWGLVGLLHDGDWEETLANPKIHTLKMLEWLTKYGENNKQLLNAISSHNYSHLGINSPKAKVDWAIYCCDELTGLIVAVALVMPDKKLQSVTVNSVIKKMHSPSFASNVNRKQIMMCEEKLNIKLSEFIEIVLKAMQNISNDLGL